MFCSPRWLDGAPVLCGTAKAAPQGAGESVGCGRFVCLALHRVFGHILVKRVIVSGQAAGYAVALFDFAQADFTSLAHNESPNLEE